ncbi:hypothetical protein [Aquisalimonas asiatica]|uniref:Yip1 domain-containing protein n=1 Tax=Aquisalimonas asiatica TaxID=406100 RepID=A0A1H8TRV0_9GAMM|nr:hypothetical protein [Aquisalimonas asiatica]SEO93585.1 hypothetical protein SAMN04488052_104416 [Aquisalimonas asiatica]
MTDLFRTLVRICLFQTGPQDLPAATSILATLIALGWGASVLVLEQLGTAGPVALEVTFATAFALLFTWLALQLRRLPNRFVQTASALFGTDLLLLIPAAPLLLATTDGDTPPLQFALLALWLWSIAIKGHIFRHALDLPISGGIAVAVLYTLLSLFLTGGA